ncbi:MAG: multiheme c-type cytochrome [Pseudomonadota bacterium]
MKYRFVLLFFLIFLIVLVSYIKNAEVPEDVHYVGSLQCESCHSNNHVNWSNSLHSKMMQKVDQLDGGFVSLHSNDISFDIKDAVWSIGSKWEQQFMGKQDDVETLLPGAWQVSKQKWKNTGWDGWQVPEPLKRCHGCHTVGLNVETGKFKEPGIGCESCHGPASWHVDTIGIGKINNSIDSQICGQCHTRGRSTDGQYFFPNGYRPGKVLNQFLKEDEPDYIQNSSKWWGNGHPRKRHQEYFSWRQSGHVNSLKSLKENYSGEYGKVTSKCLSCHAGEAINDNQSDSYQLEDVQYGITCAVCHNTHGDLDKSRLTCSSCHREGASHHNPDDNDKHVACPQEAGVQCQQCHMPLTVMNGGDYTLHSHRAGIIPPSDTRKFGVPNSCANGGCHDDRDIEWLDTAYKQHYKK